MAQNIIELGFDIARFNADKVEIFNDLKAMYEMCIKINDTKIVPHAGVGWAELKQQVQELKRQVAELQETNLKLVSSQEKVTKSTTDSTNVFQKSAASVQEASNAEKLYAENAATLYKVLAANEVALKRLTATKKQLSEQDKAGEITTEEYVSALAKVNEMINQYKTNSASLTTAIKNIEKAEQEAEGSLNKMRAQLNLMLYTQDKIGNSTEEEIQLKKELGEQIKVLTKQISEQEQAQGKFGRNVGNYANSMAEGFEKVRMEIARLNQEKEKLENQRATDPAGFAARGGDKEIQRTMMALSELDKVQMIALNNTQSFDRQLRSLVTQLKNMTMSGNVSKEFLEEFEREVAKLKVSAKNMNDELRASFSEHKNLDLMAGAVKTMVSSFQLAAGAVGLFGANTENANKITAQMVAIQNVANGVRELAYQLTNKATAAGMAYAYVQKQIAVATDASAAASARWMASLKLFGIAATVIVGLLAVFDVFKRKLSEAEKAQERLNKVSSEAIDVYQSQAFEVDNLVRKIKDENTSSYERIKILEEVNEKYSGLVGELNSVNELESIFIAKADMIKESLMLRAQAQAAYGMAIEASKTQLRAQMYLEQAGIDVKSKWFKKTEEGSTVFLKALSSAYNGAKKETNALLKIFQDAMDKAEDIEEKLNPGRLGQLFGSKIGDEFEEPEKTKPGPKRDFASEMKKNADEELKALNEIELRKLKAKMDATKRLMENEELSFKERQELEIKYYEESLLYSQTKAAQEVAELERQHQEEIKKADGHKGLLESINKEYAAKMKLLSLANGQEIEEITRQFEERITENQKKEMEKRKAQQLQMMQEQQDHYVAMYEIGQAKMKNSYDKRNIELDSLFNSGQIKEKEYNKRKLELQAEFQIEALQKEIEFTKEVLKMAYIRAQATMDQGEIDKVAKGFEQLKGLENNLQDAMQRVAKAKKDATKNEWKETFMFIAGIAQDTIGIIGGFVDANITKQKNAIQELINKNNEYGQAELTRILESTLSEEEKAAKVIQLKAEVDSKNQQYAKRQRDLDIEKAKFDKSAAIANIILNTAMAVVKALPNVPLAILAGVMGAAQLAVAAATPVPTYAEGTDNHPGGLARYGEAGPEKVVLPGGKSFIADKDTTSYLPPGTKVIPLKADEINDAMYGSMIQNMAERAALVDAVEKMTLAKDESWKIARWQAEETRKAMEANNRKQHINITNKIDLDWINYLNKNVFGK